MLSEIECPGAYAAAVRKDRMTRLSAYDVRYCTACGALIGKAVKANGTTYLADAREINGCWFADKSLPHGPRCAPKAWSATDILIGAPVVVVKGRKVAKGTRGIVAWRGCGDYGDRCGLWVDGVKGMVWIAQANLAIAGA